MNDLNRQKFRNQIIRRLSIVGCTSFQSLTLLGYFKIRFSTNSKYFLKLFIASAAKTSDLTFSNTDIRMGAEHEDLRPTYTELCPDMEIETEEVLAPSDDDDSHGDNSENDESGDENDQTNEEEKEDDSLNVLPGTFDEKASNNFQDECEEEEQGEFSDDEDAESDQDCHATARGAFNPCPHLDFDLPLSPEVRPATPLPCTPYDFTIPMFNRFWDEDDTCFCGEWPPRIHCEQEVCGVDVWPSRVFFTSGNGLEPTIRTLFIILTRLPRLRPPRPRFLSGLCEPTKARPVLVSQPKPIAHDNQYGAHLFTFVLCRSR